MLDKYILEGKIPKLVEDVLEWGLALEVIDRCVAKTELPNKVTVSTVFLALDHAFDGGEPILFETMIFGGEHDDFQERYHTWEEAEEGHKRAIAMVEEGE